MENETRLPRNGKEFLLFLGVISIISVNIIAPIIMAFEFGGMTKEVYMMALKTMPFIWICVVLLEGLLVGPLVEKLVGKFTKKTDSFNAHILFNILFSVTILSFLLTIIGTWIGTRTISLDPIRHLFLNWPRNFFIALWVETLIAQPIARFVMKKFHEKQSNAIVKTENL
ncbi:hypothetical membrane protein [Carnobacterium sp. 17-4]|uniref:hypothetical protein n=1 Tax=Carnobacterium sp. (strain 17-4) TaxID=208596 RepID=UPI0002058D14|nr:hypothetical protein [Carnobacterium sp. 17-4]AEB30741.1 hypothetical membrane protein [Carnobacterium sp. 17-4]